MIVQYSEIQYEDPLACALNNLRLGGGVGNSNDSKESKMDTSPDWDKPESAFLFVLSTGLLQPHFTDEQIVQLAVKAKHNQAHTIALWKDPEFGPRLRASMVKFLELLGTRQTRVILRLLIELIQSEECIWAREQLSALCRCCAKWWTSSNPSTLGNLSKLIKLLVRPPYCRKDSILNHETQNADYPRYLTLSELVRNALSRRDKMSF